MTVPKETAKIQEKRKEFSFYASPLSIIHILGLLILAFLIDHFINSFLGTSHRYFRYESAIPYIVCVFQFTSCIEINSMVINNLNPFFAKQTRYY